MCAQRSSKFQRHIVKCVIFFHLNLQTVKHALPPSPPRWFKVKRSAACPSGGFLTPLHIITYYCFFVIRLWIFEESSRCSWWRLKLITWYSSFGNTISINHFPFCSFSCSFLPLIRLCWRPARMTSLSGKITCGVSLFSTCSQSGNWALFI